MTYSDFVSGLILRDASLSGVYRTARAERAAAAEPAGIARVNLAGAMTKEAVLQRIAAALEFPAWFGANWDALQDCLCDLSWRETPVRLLVIEDAGGLLAASPGDWATLLEVLAESAAFWAAQEQPFFALLVDPRGDFDLPALPGEGPA